MDASERSGDWVDIKPDAAAAPFQRNLGDYITLMRSGTALVAAWTAGDSLGRPRIVVRVGEERR
jgi:hypothetical protein